MENRITATFVRRRWQDSGSENTMDYYVYDFTNIKGSDGKKHSDKYIKETKLMSNVPFKQGKEYAILLSENRPYAFNSINLPYPVEIAWDEGKVYMKNGNSIIRVDKDSKKKNLSPPRENRMGLKNNYESGIFNKFMKGTLTEELLIKINARQVYFRIHYCDPQDKRKSQGISFSYLHDKDKGNYVLIEKETQIEIERAWESIKRSFVSPDLEKHFKLITNILPPKKRR